MKKTATALIIVLLCCFVMTACISTDTNDNNNYVEKPSDTTGGSIETTIPVTKVDLFVDKISVWEVDSYVKIETSIAPFNASNKKVVWTSSKEEVAYSSYLYDSTIRTGVPGVTTLTATAHNGVSSSILFEVKPFITDLPEVPISFDKGTSSYKSTYAITDIRYTWYYYSDTSKENFGKFTGELVFKFSGAKIFDSQGENNSTTNYIKINLYDKDGYLVDDSMLFFSSMFLNDKFKDNEVVFYVKTSGAPYSIRIAT